MQIKSQLYSCTLPLALRRSGVLSFAQRNRPAVHAVTQAIASPLLATRIMSNSVEASLLTGLSKEWTLDPVGIVYPQKSGLF